MKLLNNYGAGYVIGTLILVPVVLWLINTFLLAGNQVSDKQVQHYIDNSIKLVIKVPELTDENFVGKEKEQYWQQLSRKGGSNFVRYYIFYEPVHKKYFKLINFDSFDIRTSYKPDGSVNMITDANTMRLSYLYDGFYMNGTVNKVQWQDPNYGSKDNPYPLFARDVIAGPPNRNGMPLVKEAFDVSEKINFLFVKEYLNRFVDKQELKSLALGNELYCD